MGRNLIVGMVIFGLVLAGVSVGAATYMSSNDLVVAQASLEKQIAATSVAAVAAKKTSVRVANGEAINLSSKDSLWSKGRLVVSDSGSDERVVFEVDPSKSLTTVGGGLKVIETSDMGDVNAGIMTGTQVVAIDLKTSSDSWSVSKIGDMDLAGDLAVGGNGEYAGTLAVNGGELSVGQGIRFTDANTDPTTKGKYKNALIVEGVIAASMFKSTGDDATEFAGKVRFNDDIFSGGKGWKISKTGDAAFNSVSTGAITAGPITASDLNGTSGAWFVASNGDAKFNGVESSTVKTGSINAATLTLTSALKAQSADVAGLVNSGSLTTKNLFVTDAAGAEIFRVNETTATIKGDLAVGRVLASKYEQANGGVFKVSTAGDVWAGNGTLKSLNVDGNIDGTFVGTLADGVSLDLPSSNMKVKGVQASDFLRVGASSAPYPFQVDTNGNLDMDGTLTLSTGDVIVQTGNIKATAGDITAGGDMKATNITATGDMKATNITATGDVKVTGDITAANLPIVDKGTATIAGPPQTVNVTITGLKPTDVVILTPRFDTGGTSYWVDVNNGDFTIHGPDGAYSYIVIR